MKKIEREELTQRIAEEITKREDTVFPYIGNGYVLDQDALHEAIKHAIEEF